MFPARWISAARNQRQKARTSAHTAFLCTSAARSGGGRCVLRVRRYFESWQNADTGEFDITGITAVNWAAVGGAAAVAAVCLIAAAIISRALSRGER